MATKRWLVGWLLGSLVLGGLPVQARDLVFLWQEPGGDLAPQQRPLTFTRTTSTDLTPLPQQVMLTRLAAETCVQLHAQSVQEANPACPVGTYTAGVTTCAVWPCPGAGAYAAYLRDNPQDVVLFGTNAQCDCVAYDEALHAQLPPDPPPVETPPAPAPPVTPVPTPEPVPIPPVVVSTPIPEPIPPAQPPPVQTPPVPSTPPPTPVAVPVRPPLVVPSGNLLPNTVLTPPWDSGSFSGTQASVSRDDSMTCAGQPSLRLEGPGHYYAQTTSQRVAIDDRLTYTLTTLVSTRDLAGIMEQDVFWYDAQGQEFPQWGEAIGGRQSGTQTCTAVRGTVQPPPGAVAAVVQYRVLADGGQAWVSGMRLEAVAPVGGPVVVPASSPPVVAEAPVASPVATSPTPVGQVVPPSSPPMAPPAAVPTIEALLAQFETLTTQYTQSEAQIRTTYEQALQQAHGRQARRQAYAQAQTALTTAYRTMVETWAQLFQQYVLLVLTQPVEAAQAPPAPVSVP
jgi:hypothetical protein